MMFLRSYEENFDMRASWKQPNYKTQNLNSEYELFKMYFKNESGNLLGVREGVKKRFSHPKYMSEGGV